MKTEDNTENWENGTLGCSEDHVRVSIRDSKQVDEDLGLVEVKFRVSKDVYNEYLHIEKSLGFPTTELFRTALSKYLRSFYI